MITYNCAVSMADKCVITKEMEELIKLACIEASGRSNAHRYGRKYKYAGLMDDNIHFRLILESDNEVPPSRAVSAVTRSILTLDKKQIVTSHISRKILFITREIDNEETIVNTLTDVELAKEITDMLFNQTNMSKGNRKLAGETADEIRQIMLGYLAKKSIN